MSDFTFTEDDLESPIEDDGDLEEAERLARMLES